MTRALPCLPRLAALCGLFGIALSLLVTNTASASCPASIPIIDQLSCSASLTSSVDHTQASQLGGPCDSGECYTCGDPWANQAQLAPEAVYTFQCQRDGNALLNITNLPCDVDIYVLDSSCDPYAGCVSGSTAPDVDDQVEFQCTAGQTYYVVLEAYGTDHLDISSNPCTDTGDATGTVFSPEYTLEFDLALSAGCSEDCNNGIDDDLDSVIDCSDPDCNADPVCCDLDDDAWFGPQCGGPDCDDNDASRHPGAPEGDGTGSGDGVDNDCDGTVDEGTDAYDDDGDGYTEAEGDCDDDDPTVSPGATEILGNGIDDDCDDSIDEEPPGDDDDSSGDDDTGDDDTGADDTGDDDSADDDDSGDDDDSSNDDDDAGSTGLGDPPRTVAENSSEFGCDCSQAPRDSVNSQPMGSSAILLALLLALTPAWLQRRRL